MESLREALQRIGEQVQRTLDASDEAREDAYPRCREIIRHSASAIRATHRREMEEARQLLQQIANEVEYLRERLRAHPEVYHSGMVYDAQKEFAEAALTYAFLTDGQVPDPESLHVEPAAYVSGLAEAVGELRRAVLDFLTEGNLERAMAIHRLMDDIFFILVGFDYPDAITPGLKRRLDMVRGVLERTRADVYHGRDRSALMEKMTELLEALESWAEEEPCSP